MIMIIGAIFDSNKFEWPYLRNASQSTYIAVIFAIAQLTCILKICFVLAALHDFIPDNSKNVKLPSVAGSSR